MKDAKPVIAGRPPTIRQMTQSERIDDMIMRELGVEEAQLGRETQLSEFDIDSLDITELSLMLEEEFELPDYALEDDIDRMKTVGDVHKYVELAIKKKGKL